MLDKIFQQFSAEITQILTEKVTKDGKLDVKASQEIVNRYMTLLKDLISYHRNIGEEIKWDVLGKEIQILQATIFDEFIKKNAKNFKDKDGALILLDLGKVLLGCYNQTFERYLSVVKKDEKKSSKQEKSGGGGLFSGFNLNLNFSIGSVSSLSSDFHDEIDKTDYSQFKFRFTNFPIDLLIHLDDDQLRYIVKDVFKYGTAEQKGMLIEWLVAQIKKENEALIFVEQEKNIKRYCDFWSKNEKDFVELLLLHMVPNDEKDILNIDKQIADVSQEIVKLKKAGEKTGEKKIGELSSQLLDLRSKKDVLIEKKISAFLESINKLKIKSEIFSAIEITAYGSKSRPGNNTNVYLMPCVLEFMAKNFSCEAYCKVIKYLNADYLHNALIGKKLGEAQTKKEEVIEVKNYNDSKLWADLINFDGKENKAAIINAMLECADNQDKVEYINKIINTICTDKSISAKDSAKIFITLISLRNDKKNQENLSNLWESPFTVKIFRIQNAKIFAVDFVIALLNEAEQQKLSAEKLMRIADFLNEKSISKSLGGSEVFNACLLSPDFKLSANVTACLLLSSLKYDKEGYLGKYLEKIGQLESKAQTEVAQALFGLKPSAVQLEQLIKAGFNPFEKVDAQQIIKFIDWSEKRDKVAVEAMVVQLIKADLNNADPKLIAWLLACGQTSTMENICKNDGLRMNSKVKQAVVKSLFVDFPGNRHKNNYTYFERDMIKKFEAWKNLGFDVSGIILGDKNLIDETKVVGEQGEDVFIMQQYLLTFSTVDQLEIYFNASLGKGAEQAKVEQFYQAFLKSINEVSYSTNLKKLLQCPSLKMWVNKLDSSKILNLIEVSAKSKCSTSEKEAIERLTFPKSVTATDEEEGTIKVMAWLLAYGQPNSVAYICKYLQGSQGMGEQIVKTLFQKPNVYFASDMIKKLESWKSLGFDVSAVLHKNKALTITITDENQRQIVLQHLVNFSTVEQLEVYFNAVSTQDVGEFYKILSVSISGADSTNLKKLVQCPSFYKWLDKLDSTQILNLLVANAGKFEAIFKIPDQLAKMTAKIKLSDFCTKAARDFDALSSFDIIECILKRDKIKPEAFAEMLINAEKDGNLSLDHCFVGSDKTLQLWIKYGLDKPVQKFLINQFNVLDAKELPKDEEEAKVVQDEVNENKERIFNKLFVIEVAKAKLAGPKLSEKEQIAMAIEKTLALYPGSEFSRAGSRCIMKQLELMSKSETGVFSSFFSWFQSASKRTTISNQILLLSVFRSKNITAMRGLAEFVPEKEIPQMLDLLKYNNCFFEIEEIEKTKESKDEIIVQPNKGEILETNKFQIIYKKDFSNASAIVKILLNGFSSNKELLSCVKENKSLCLVHFAWIVESLKGRDPNLKNEVIIKTLGLDKKDFEAIVRTSSESDLKKLVNGGFITLEHIKDNKSLCLMHLPWIVESLKKRDPNLKNEVIIKTLGLDQTDFLTILRDYSDSDLKKLVVEGVITTQNIMMIDSMYVDSKVKLRMAYILTKGLGTTIVIDKKSTKDYTVEDWQKLLKTSSQELKLDEKDLAPMHEKMKGDVIFKSLKPEDWYLMLQDTETYSDAVLAKLIHEKFLTPEVFDKGIIFKKALADNNAVAMERFFKLATKIPYCNLELTFSSAFSNDDIRRIIAKDDARFCKLLLDERVDLITKLFVTKQGESNVGLGSLIVNPNFFEELKNKLSAEPYKKCLLAIRKNLTLDDKLTLFTKMSANELRGLMKEGVALLTMDDLCRIIDLKDTNVENVKKIIALQGEPEIKFLKNIIELCGIPKGGSSTEYSGVNKQLVRKLYDYLNARDPELKAYSTKIVRGLLKCVDITAEISDIKEMKQTEITGLGSLILAELNEIMAEVEGKHILNPNFKCNVAASLYNGLSGFNDNLQLMDNKKVSDDLILFLKYWPLSEEGTVQALAKFKPEDLVTIMKSWPEAKRLVLVKGLELNNLVGMLVALESEEENSVRECMSKAGKNANLSNLIFCELETRYCSGDKLNFEWAFSESVDQCLLAQIKEEKEESKQEILLQQKPYTQFKLKMLLEERVDFRMKEEEKVEETKTFK